MEDLAERLRCSKSTIYGIASSREQIIVTAMQRFLRRCSASSGEAVARIEARVAERSDPRQRVTAYVTAVGEEMRRRSPACYADSGPLEATDELYHLNGRASATRIRELISEEVEAGVFCDVHAQFVGGAVALLIEGLVDGRLLDRTGLPSQEA